MAIPDPRAIPETPDAATEYATAADAAWTAGDPSAAWDLYHSVFTSEAATTDQRSHSAYRLALIALNRGDHEQARRFAWESSDTGAKDLLSSLDNATTDATPDPNRAVVGTEEADRYWRLGTEARGNGDSLAASQWFIAIATGSDLAPNYIAQAEFNVAQCLISLGEEATARGWLERALPNLTDPASVEFCRKILGKVGVHGVTSDIPAVKQLDAGIESFQLGDLAAARAALEAALHLDGSTDEVKGRAEYYLGSMAFQAKQYADARDHLGRASTLAPDPEKSWAHEMLQWEWQDT